MSKENNMKNLEKLSNMKNMLNVSLIDILIPDIKSHKNDNVIKMLEVVKDKPEVYINLLSVAIFHNNKNIVEIILDKYFNTEIEEPYLNTQFLNNAILPENSKYKLTDSKDNYLEEVCPFSVMIGIGGNIDIFKILYQKHLINSYNINKPGIIGLTKKYKNSFFSNIVGACAYYGNDKLLEYILENYRQELDINLNTIEKKSKNSKFHFMKEFSGFSPSFLGIAGNLNDKKSVEILKIFEEFRANFESKDFNENNIIHIATREKKILTLKFLIESLGLKNLINEYNLINETPFIIAQKNKNKEIISFFDKYLKEDEDIIKKNMEELISEDNKRKNKNKNKKQKNNKDNIQFLNSNEYEEMLPSKEEKIEEKKEEEKEEENNDLNDINEDNISYNEDKEEEEEVDEIEQKGQNNNKNKNKDNYGYNNKKYKNKKNNNNTFKGNKNTYNNEYNTYNDYSTYNTYIYDNSSRYNKNNKIYYNDRKYNDKYENYNKNNDYYYNSYNNINNDYNNNYYYNNNDYYDEKRDRKNNKDKRGKYKNKENKRNKNIKEKALAVEIDTINDKNINNENDNNNENNNSENSDYNENKNNSEIKEVINDKQIKNEKNIEIVNDNIKGEDKNNTDEKNIIKKAEKNLEEEEEEEEEYSYSEEDFLSQKSEKKEDKKEENKEEKNEEKKIEISEYSNLFKKYFEMERRVNILEKERKELNQCIQKMYINKNNKQNIPNNEQNILSLLDLANKELEKKDKIINKLKNETKMADLSDIKNFEKDKLKEFKNFYSKNLKIINDTLKLYEK